MTKKRNLKISNDSFCRINNGDIKIFDYVPAQADSETLVLNVDSAVSMIFSEQAVARAGTTAANEISQIYSDSDSCEYSLQWDAENQVKYLDYLERVKFAFIIDRPGDYYIWMRVFLPRNGTWNYYESMNGGTLRECFIEGYDAGKWFWYRSPLPQKLVKGGNFLELARFIGGKRLEQIVISKDSEFIPDSSYCASPLKLVESALIETETIFPQSADKLEIIKIPFSGEGLLPEINLFIGKKKIITEVNVKKYYINISVDKISIKDACAEGLKLSMTIKRDSSGDAVSISYPKLEYFENKDSLLLMKSNNARIYFEPQNGDIVEAGIVNKNKYKPVVPSFSKLSGPILSMVHREKEFTINEREGCSVEILSLSETEVTKKYTWVKYGIVLSTSIKPGKDNLFSLQADIENNGQMIIKSIKWPVVPSLAFSKGGVEDVLMLPRYEPELVKGPAQKGVLQEVYPRGAMNWMDLSGNDTGIFLCALDKDLILTRFASVPSSAEDYTDLSLEKIHYIHPGESKTYEYTLGLHAGDWHWSADRYREIFSKIFTLQTFYPDWAIDSNGWYTAFLASIEADLPEIQPPEYTKVTEHHIDRAWHLGTDHIQMWGQGAMDHNCPTYYLPDPERGGETAFKEMVRDWKNTNLKIGSYFHSSSLNPFFAQAKEIRGVSRESIPKELRPPDWNCFVRNYDYSKKEEKELSRLSNDVMEAVKKHESVIPRKYPRMSSFSTEWYDYMRIWINKYLNEYSHSVIYHDQMGNAPQHIEFNSYLGIDGAGNGASKIYEYIKSLYELFSLEKNDFFQIQEAVTDALSVYAAPMTSGFHRNPEVYRYTFPNHIMYFGHANGCWKDRMQYEMLQISFLEGMKFDILRIKPDSQELVWLRDSLRYWFFRGTYRHNLGVNIKDADAQWRCFYTNTKEDQALMISLCNISDETCLEYDEKLYGNFKKAVFFAPDGHAQSLTINNNSIKLPECKTGALLFIRKVSDARQFWVQALPDSNISENGILHLKAIALNDAPLETKIEICEYNGIFKESIDVKLGNNAKLLERDIVIPKPLQRRIIIKTPQGNYLRRFAGRINGTYWGYPFNRKNLRFHFHEVPEGQKERILKYEY